MDNSTQVEGIIVTGSRIVRPNLDQPTPISTLSSQEIVNAGTSNLADIITLLPSVGFTGTTRANSNNFGNGAGLSQINLRDLGISRTLVLVDGQRHVAGDISNNAVDLNSIPAALVDHVEVVTGGASAIYGSDAVTGVVNIILKKKFEGVEANAQVGGYDNGFGAEYNAYATVGHNFDFGGDRKLNITATGYWTKQAGIDARNIPTAHNYGTIANPNDLPAGTFDPTYYSSGAPITNDGIPDRLYVQNVGSDLVSRGGALIDYVALATTGKLQPVLQFDAAGHPITPLARSGYNSSAFAQLPENCGVACYFTEDYEQLRTPLETKGADFTAHYDQNPHLHFSLDAKYAESDAVNTIQPSFSFGDYQLQDDNAFITPEIRAALAANRAAAAALVGPADASELNPLIGKFINNGRTEDVKRQTYRFVLGANGDFDARLATINWSAALNYGETDTRFDNKNLVITQNFAAALDSVIDPRTGQAACRVNVPSAQAGGLPYGETPFNASSCVPFNPFGIGNSQAVQDYISGSYISRDKLSQQVFSLNGSTDSSRFFNFQGGPVAVAVGAEYRMERTHETNDPFVNAGNTENLSSDSAGGYNVYEGYIEAEAPFFKHAGPGLDEVSLNAAYRGSYYSTVGHTDAYKFGGVYGPFRDIKFRATYSRAVRAPNITEAFLPPSGGFFNVSDPCDATNIGSNVNYAKNCAAAGVPAGFTSSTNASITGLTSGNPNLDPEKSISYTGGFILQPHWIPRLSVTVDYYAIKIKNAITQVAAQDIIDNCYSGASLDPQYCSLFTRGGDNNINFVQTTYVNASKVETDGIDLTANYAVPVSGLTSRWAYSRFLDGRLSFDLNANYVIHLRNFPFQNIPDQVHILEGTEVDPKLKALLGVTYQQGGLQVAWQTRYLGRTANFSRDAEAADHSESTNIPFNKAEFLHNLVVRYDLPGQRFRGAQVYGGVNNIFNEQPPGYLLGTLNDVGYDLGRYLFAGIRFRR